MPLTFVERDEYYSVYREPDGTVVLLSHGSPPTRSIEFDYDEMQERWSEHKAVHGTARHSKSAFREFMRKRITEPDMADEIVFCCDCDRVDTEDEVHGTSNGSVCESCYEEYSWCSSCEESCRETNTTMNDESVCESCCDRHYSWCEDCDGYYYSDHGGHDHDDEDEEEGAGCCESPAPNFTIRNDGDPALANDTRVTVSLPAGVIDSEGLQRIASHLYDQGMYDASYLLDQLGDQWQTKEGNYTKRFSRLVYQKLAEKVQPAVLSQIGCIAREHSTSVDFAIEITRDLNQSAEDFGHGESCWWQSYYPSRCTLKSNGGFGLRSFGPYGVNGRAWVMPLKQELFGLTPTFNTETPDAFVTFNGYGALNGYNAARIMSHMAGMTYRKIVFECQPMYVNFNSNEESIGYLVAPEEIAAGYTDGHLCLNVDQHSNLYRSEVAAAAAAAATAAKEPAHV